MADRVFFAASTGGFYHQSVHGERMPADAVEITPDEHRELIAANHERGLLITTDADSRPIAIDPPPPPLKVRLARLRQRRDSTLSATAWRVAPDEPEPDRAAWTLYRKAVRELIDADTDPSSLVWPQAPA